MSDTPTPETYSVTRSYVLFTTPDGSIRLRTTIDLHHVREDRGQAFDAFSKVVEERDEARRELDEARRALEWIAGAYCHEKTTFQLAQAAYEMSSKARWTLQKIEQKEEA